MDCKDLAMRAIVAVFILEFVALLTGVNGVGLTVAVGAICTITGYVFGRKHKGLKNENG